MMNLSGQRIVPVATARSTLLVRVEQPFFGDLKVRQLRMDQGHHCWCGNTNLTAFSPEYDVCLECRSLVSKRTFDNSISHVAEEESGLYGREYWYSHQERDFGYPNIEVRAREDLPERCIHWMQTLLKYKAPPGQVLELGCAHGGFVAMLKWAGFDAVGLELSSSIAEFASRTFGVPVLVGSVEKQDIPAASLDCIALMDVLEHLPDPIGTMRYCLHLLKPDGMMMVQTPCYPESLSFEQMTA